MTNDVEQLVYSYFRQQAALGVPDYILSAPFQNSTAAYDTTEYAVAAVGAVREETPSYETRRTALVELYYEVKNCKGCLLGSSRGSMVFGSGNAAAAVMIIGEAPGQEEDIQGKPFVGKAGALLTKMLAAIQLNREKDVFITNILKCRPPENRDPNQHEMVACTPILKRQIAIIKPRAILLLGRIAAHELLGVSDSIVKLRTETHNYNKIPVVVTYHPAALLRYEQYKRPAWEDLQRLQRILREIGVYGKQQ